MLLVTMRAVILRHPVPVTFAARTLDVELKLGSGLESILEPFPTVFHVFDFAVVCAKQKQRVPVV